jgi:hypothetical protein
LRLPWFRLGAVAVASAAAVACSYTYSNPAERLAAGEISGRTVADPEAQGVPHPTGGIAVSLKGSSFDQVTHDTGRFTMLPLPSGQHTLLFRRGAQLALVRRVTVALGPNGQPDGVTLGDVEVPFAGVIAGTFTGAEHAGVVVDETTGLTATAIAGRYQLDGASLGDHRLKLGIVSTGDGKAWVGGPLDLTLGDEAQSSVTRAAVVAVHEASGTGGLRLRVVSLDAGIAPGDVSVVVEDVIHGPVAPAPVPDARGDVDLTVPEGVYKVRIEAPPAHAGGVTTPAPATAIVLQGETAEVGSLYLVPPGVIQLAQLSCQSAADCGPLACLDGRCLDWAPPPYVPAGIPICSGFRGICGPGQPCTTTDGVPGGCFDASGGAQVCVPCATSCALDGTSVLRAASPDPFSGQCP